MSSVLVITVTVRKRKKWKWGLLPNGCPMGKCYDFTDWTLAIATNQSKLYRTSDLYPRAPIMSFIGTRFVILKTMEKKNFVCWLNNPVFWWEKKPLKVIIGLKGVTATLVCRNKIIYGWFANFKGIRVDIAELKLYCLLKIGVCSRKHNRKTERPKSDVALHI